MLTRLSGLSAAALALALVLPAAPAHAASVGVIEASGVLSPGIPATGCEFQDIEIAGTAVVAGTDEGSGVHGFTFSGHSSICESALAGQGVGALSGGVSGTIGYTRTGAVLIATGNVSVGGSAAVPVEIRCTVVVTVSGEGVIVEFTKYCYVVLHFP